VPARKNVAVELRPPRVPLLLNVGGGAPSGAEAADQV